MATHSDIIDVKLKKRTPFTNAQKAVLEKYFSSRHYLAPNDRESLALKLSLSGVQVRTWFQNRRTKVRRSEERAYAQAEERNIVPENTPISSPSSPPKLQYFQISDFSSETLGDVFELNDFYQKMCDNDAQGDIVYLETRNGFMNPEIF